MAEKPRDDTKFLINTFAFTLIIVAIIVSFQPYLEYETRLPEIKKVEASIVDLNPSDLPGMLLTKKGKPAIFVAYASWCYFCRQVMPLATEMVAEHKLDGYNVIFASMDTEPRRLSQYLVHYNYNTIVLPYVLAHTIPGSISSAMQPSGSHFRGVIPYIGVFGQDGKVEAESVGVAGGRALLEDLASNKEKYEH